MTAPVTITRADFLGRFAPGVELDSPELGAELARAGLSRGTLDTLDRDGDGKIAGAELSRAFRHLDSFDRNGSARSFVASGTAEVLYRALEAGRGDRTDGLGVAISALSRAQHMSADYSYAGAPTSPHAGLSHNEEPGVSRLEWLRDRHKCNQFVGDALTEAGMLMPTFRMGDGSEHYMNAEALPRQHSHFARIGSTEQVRLGDVVVIDYSGRGSGGAHAEIVTGRNHEEGTLFMTGAHPNGARELDRSSLLDGAAYRADAQCWERPDGTKIYVLRPLERRKDG